MGVPTDFWDAIPGPETLDREANVELRLVIPLLEALGYDRNIDIASKYPVEFQQGRVGRKPEADFVCFYGPLRNRNNSLIVVEVKAAREALSDGKAQGESYAQNLRAPLLLLTNGRTLEIWQQQPTLESECVLQIPVNQLAANRGKIEQLLNKTAVRDYCNSLKFKTIAEKTADFGGYETAELTRMLSVPPVVGRTLTLKRASTDKVAIASEQLLETYPRGAIVVGPSGYGKTTLSCSIFRQAIEARWQGQSQSIAIEAPLPDIEASGSEFMSFLLQRLQAHQPGVTDAHFRNFLRGFGVTAICDSLDRTSPAFQRKIETAISLFLRDYPLSRVFMFSRADAKPTVALPTLALEPLSDGQIREMEKVILVDGSATYGSIISAAPPTLRSLCGNPLILKLALEHWQRHRDFPRDVDMLFRSWLESVLEAEPNDQVSRLRRERALSVIAKATTESPLPGLKLIALLRDSEIDEAVLNELIRCDAVRVTDAVMDLQHDSLADYLRAKAFAEMSVPDQMMEMSRLTVPPDSFLPVLLMAQLVDPRVREALWKHMVLGPIDTYLDALRYRRDASEDLERLGQEDLSRGYLTDLLNGVEEPLDGFFPALRPAVVEWLTDARDEPLAIIGAANPHGLSYKMQAREPNSPRVAVGVPSFPGTIRGVSFDVSRYRTDSARLLGMTLLGKSIDEIIESLDVNGGPVWAGERLIGRVRFLVERYGFPIPIGADLTEVERVLRPHADQRYQEGPLDGGLRFSFRSMLDDVTKLQSAGVTTLDPWWSRLGWNGCLSSACLSDNVLTRLLDEEYRRTQLIYKEIVEASFQRFSQDMMFYPILPLRWSLRVVRGGPLERTFVIYPRWMPVRDWEDAGADVSFDGPWPDLTLPWDEARKALVGLGRTPNIPHYGGFTTHAGYNGATLNGHFDGATPATNEAISWLADEAKRIFRNLPHSDGSFSV